MKDGYHDRPIDDEALSTSSHAQFNLIIGIPSGHIGPDATPFEDHHIRIVLFSSMALLATLGAQGASAQSFDGRECVARPVRIAVETMPLRDALGIFTKTTECPVSLDRHKVGDMDSGDVTTTVIKGRYTPATALRLMLRNTPFKSRPIKGGFSIS